MISADLEMSQGASSATSYRRQELPEKTFEVLFQNMLMSPAIRDTCRQIFDLKGEFRFIRILTSAIEGFCSDLLTENSNEKNAILVIWKYSRYFALRALQDCRQSEQEEGKQATHPEERDSKAESPLKERLTHGETVPGTDLEERSYRMQSGILESEHERNTSDDGKDSGDSDDYQKESPDLPPNEQTISWLTQSISLQNFQNNLLKVTLSPLKYIERVLESSLPTSGPSFVSFVMEWGLLEYMQSELGEGQKLSKMLTLTGNSQDAYASSCLEYCVKTWPDTGEGFLSALEKAIECTQHRKSAFRRICHQLIMN